MLTTLAIHQPSLWALAACCAAAVAEGVLSGRGVKSRLAELKMPRFAPGLRVWTLIGVAYYVLFFLLLRTLLSTPSGDRWTELAIVLTTVLLILNAGWNWVFFRKKDLRLGFLLFFPYLSLAIALLLILLRLKNPLLIWYACYLLYLVVAAVWAFRVWQLNSDS